MKTNHINANSPGGAPLTTELLLLPDGRILVHNLTPAFAQLLQELSPDDGQVAARSRRFSPRARPVHDQAQAGILRHASPITPHELP